MEKAKDQKLEPLELGRLDLPMSERLALALEKMIPTVGKETADGSKFVLRNEQVGIFSSFFRFAEGLVKGNEQSPMGRIILPPRTGKTVVAGHIIITTGLTAVFLVPTQALVEQTAQEISKQLPGVPIGVYYDKEKNLVSNGVNITTYQSLHNLYIRYGQFPEPIAKSALVFTDEGHMAMTLYRQTFLKGGFDPLAVKIALTATPDYNEKRQLRQYFPRLIHEMPVDEAWSLDLLAPTRFWLVQVDEDASKVKLQAGDYREDTLATVMSTASFFATAVYLRYSPENRSKSALICCKTRPQARAFYKYLCRERPTGTPCPQLVLAGTAKAKRKNILSRYDQGQVDTIVIVGVLVQGWNAPRCKLEIDMALSCSLVRAKQKYFRPMTKWGNEEAHIYVLAPVNLPRPPVLPLEVISENYKREEYVAGELIRTRSSSEKSGPTPTHPVEEIPIKGVHIIPRITFATRSDKTGLDPNNIDKVREILQSNPTFDPMVPWQYTKFCCLFFEHDLFQGSGRQLLRHLGIEPSKKNYIQFLTRVFPEGVSDLYMDFLEHGFVEGGDSVDEDNDRWEGGRRNDEFAIGILSGDIPTKGKVDEDVARETWRALGGFPDEETSEQPNHDFQLFLPQRIREALAHLRPQREYVLRERIMHGLTLQQISDKLGLTRERARGIEVSALRDLRVHDRQLSCNAEPALRDFL